MKRKRLIFKYGTPVQFLINDKELTDTCCKT